MSQVTDKPEWAQSRRERQNAQRIAQGLKPKRRIWPWTLLVLVIAGIVAMVMLQPPAPPEPEPVADEQPLVMQIRQSETIVVAPATLRETVKVTGTLVPGRQSEVASQASGRVIAVMVRPGDAVQEGDVLAQIDRASLELQLNQQRATADATRVQLDSSRQQLDRTEQLASQGLASPSTLEQARSSTAALQANLSALESAVATAELALANATVKSPLSGMVASRSVEPGQTISAGTPLFTIVNLSDMEFDATASVTASARVAAGQPVSISVAGLEGHDFEGTVTRVNPVAMAGTRTMPIYIALNNDESRLRGGLFATGFVTITEKSNAIAVPAASLREDAEGDYVLELVDGVITRLGVEIVAEWERGSIIEVTGPQQGDVVVSAPLPDLAVGDAYMLVEG